MNKIISPLLIPDQKILRYDERLGFYEIFFDKKSIEALYLKYQKGINQNKFKIEHKSELIYDEIELSKSFILDESNCNNLPSELFNILPIGTWMIEVKVNNERLFLKLKEENKLGLSVEVKLPIKNKEGKTFIVNENFERISKLSDLLPCEIWVHGGSTNGHGKNEHGKAHFELKEKGTQKPLGKIFMPTLNEWKNATKNNKIKLMKVYNGTDLKTKQKKMIVHWLEFNNNENLKKCHRYWNEKNKDNNRTERIL